AAERRCLGSSHPRRRRPPRWPCYASARARRHAPRRARVRAAARAARRARAARQSRLRSPPHPEPRSDGIGLVNGSRALQGRKPRLRNVVAAFAVAPLGGGALVAPIALIGALFGQVTAKEVFMLPILFSILGYVAAVVFGIPGYLIFRRLGWINRAHWVLL